MKVVAVGDSVTDAETVMDAAESDVLLLDVRLGTQSGLTALRGKTDGRPAVVVLTAYDYPQYAEAALRLGASGFVLKNGPITELLAAIRAAAAGGIHFGVRRSEEYTSELQSPCKLVCRLLLEKKQPRSSRSTETHTLP